MGNGSRRTILDAAFRIARESAINALFSVMLVHQTSSSTRPSADVRKRAQSLVLGMQETIAADIDLPGFLEELGAVGCGVTDGSDAALVAVVTCLQDQLTGSIPPMLAEELREPVLRATSQLMLGWLERRERDATPSKASSVAAGGSPEPERDLGRNVPFRASIEQAPVATTVFDLQAETMIFFNPAMERLFGFTLAEELELSPEQMQNEDSADDDFELLLDMLAGRIPFLERVSARPHKDGHSVPFHLLAWPIRDDSGNVTHLVNQIADARTRSAATSGSGIAEKRARFLMQISPDPVLITRADGVIRYASPSVDGALGEDPDALVGRTVQSLMTSPSVERADQLMCAVAGVPRVRIVVELEFRLSDGSTRWFEVAATNMLDVDDVDGIVLQSRDITERRELQATLERMTKTESLTGLLNRRGVLERLNGWLDRRRAGPDAGRFDGSVACFIDLNDFKSINDRFGHSSGDAVLGVVSGRIGALIEGRGFAGRMGGDEFVILAELSDESERLQFLQDLGRTLDGVVHHEDRDIPFSGSVGTIDLNPDALGELDAFAILREADNGLRIAKARRRKQSAVLLD